LKLQESKKEALKIVKNNLMEQSFSLKERLKKRKIARLQNKRAPKKDKKEEEYDLVYVDNSTPFTNKAQSNEADEE